MVSKTELALLSMEEELSRTEQVSDRASQNRSKIIAKLEAAVDKIEFTSEDIRDPKATTALLSIIDKYNSVNKDEESSAFKRVSAKARLKEIKSNEQQSEATIAMINKLCDRTSSELDDNYLGDVTEVELNLSPELSETISDLELRGDPDDLT